MNKTKKTAKETTPPAAPVHAAETELPELELVPPVDIEETEDAYILTFEVPGANAESVDIQVDNGVLSIFARSSLIRHGHKVFFRRLFQLSHSVDVTKIKASTIDGVLILTMPKSVHARVHKIKVS